MTQSLEKQLYDAAENGQLETVKYLVEQGADIHACDNLSLRWAARYGHLKIVEYLVGQGADIHARNDQAFRWAKDNEFLCYAVHNDHLQVVKYLKKQMEQDDKWIKI